MRLVRCGCEWWLLRLGLDLPSIPKLEQMVVEKLQKPRQILMSLSPTRELGPADGGGTSANGPFILSGTLGQLDSGVTMTGGGSALVGGFWSLDPDKLPANPNPQV